MSAVIADSKDHSYALAPRRWTARTGDTVVIYQGVSDLSHIKLAPMEIFRGRFGEFNHDDMIGRPFGSKIYARKQPGWAYMLALTPELWTATLSHRTQILYAPDISMVLLQLGITPGSVVIESGTGSGSLSHAFIRALAPGGHLYTYEFNRHRVEAAREEFKDHKLQNCVTIQHRDVCQDGFDPFLIKMVDAVFLDLPMPWEAIPHAKRVLKVQGRICAFSPCIEQVQQNCLALKQHGFEDIMTLETVTKSFSVNQDTRTPATPIKLFQEPDETMDEDSLEQVASAKRSRIDPNETSNASETEIANESTENVTQTDNNVHFTQDTDVSESGKSSPNYISVRRRNKRGQAYIQHIEVSAATAARRQARLVKRRSEHSNLNHQLDAEDLEASKLNADQIVGSKRPTRRALPTSNPIDGIQLAVAQDKSVRGHTGYLTFAILRSHETANS